MALIFDLIPDSVELDTDERKFTLGAAVKALVKIVGILLAWSLVALALFAGIMWAAAELINDNWR